MNPKTAATVAVISTAVATIAVRKIKAARFEKKQDAKFARFVDSFNAMMNTQNGTEGHIFLK